MKAAPRGDVPGSFTPLLSPSCRAEHSHHLDLLLSKAFPRQLLHALEVTRHWSGKDTVQSHPLKL